MTCSCGKTLRVADEHAGKRVKCPACAASLTVPGGGAPPPADPDTVRFSCPSCGKEMQARAEHAGKKARCPACDERVDIPDAAGRAITADRPSARARLGRDDDLDRRRDDDDRDRRRDDDDFEEDRPRKKKKARKGGRALWPWLVGGGVVLAGGVGVLLWFLLGGSTPEDLEYVPENASAFVSVRFADVMKQERVKAAIKAAGGRDNPLDEMEKETGIKPEDVERFTVVVADAASGPESSWGILLTKSPYDQGKVKDSVKDRKQTKHDGKTIYYNDTNAVCLAGPKVILVGKLEGVKKALDRRGKNKKEGPIRDGVKLASDGKYHLVAAAVVPSDARSERLPPQMAFLKEIVGGTLTAQIVGTDLSLELKATTSSASAAKEMKEAMAGVKDLVRLQGGNMPLAVRTAVANALDGLKCQTSGKEVTISTKFELNDDVLAALARNVGR
jgi:hypothetical protein